MIAVQRTKPVVIVALGNDILGDDGVSFHAARLLRDEFAASADVIETGEAGLALLDHLEGYERALILDAVATGRCPPGTIHYWGAEDFKQVLAPSPHCAGLPQLLELAKRVGLSFPQELRVIAMEVHDPTVFREALTPQAREALPAFVAAARQLLLEEWGGP